jgi:hypothetical protein
MEEEMDLNTDEMIAWLESEEGKKHLEKCVQDIIDKENRRREFEVHNQDEVMIRLLEILIREGSLDGEQILYSPEKYNITEEEFNYLFDNIEDYADKNGLSCVDRECYFPNGEWYCIYKNTKLIFKTMSGQGTATWIVLANDEDQWNDEKCFEYEKYKMFQ